LLNGNTDTVPALRAEHFDFRSSDAAAAVNFLIQRCNIAVARAFLAEGAPPVASGDLTPILSAARCGDSAFARELIAAGAFASPGVADAFLSESSATGSPEMVGEALRHSRAVNRVDEYGRTPLFSAASAQEPSAGEPRPAHFDKAAVISALLAAGADARRIDREGNSVLHNVRDGPSARLLLRAGANPKAVNGRGQTALFSQSNGDVVRLLLQAQVDPNVRDAYGQTALYSANSADVARALVTGGASLTVVDNGGQTPLEGCNNEDVALALIELGSPIPTGARFDALVRRASPYWTRLIHALQARAATMQGSAPH
jgi:ankyrin repeat protein